MANKLFKSKFDVIVTIIALIFIVGILVSPKMFKVSTARWQEWDEKNTQNVQAAMGTEKTEEHFRLYFQYYNVVHELAHGLLHYNHGVNLDVVDEEQLVNDFAVAYWNHYGEPEKMEELHEIVNYAVVNISDNAKNGVDYLENARAHSNGRRFDNDFFNFEDYGWFQFSSVKHAIEHSKSLEEVLHEMGFEDFTIPEKTVLKHEMTSEAESTAVINEAVENFNSWGLKFPPVHQTFESDPNMNSSIPSKNIFFIYSLFK